MPICRGIPARGDAGCVQWRRALNAWLALLFPDGSWQARVSERPEAQHASSKRRDDVSFLHTTSDDLVTSYRTFKEVLQHAQAAGHTLDELDALAGRVGNSRRRVHKADRSETEAECAVATPGAVLAKRSRTTREAAAARVAERAGCSGAVSGATLAQAQLQLSAGGVDTLQTEAQLHATQAEEANQLCLLLQRVRAELPAFAAQVEDYNTGHDRLVSCSYAM